MNALVRLTGIEFSLPILFLVDPRVLPLHQEEGVALFSSPAAAAAAAASRAPTWRCRGLMSVTHCSDSLRFPRGPVKYKKKRLLERKRDEPGGKPPGPFAKRTTRERRGFRLACKVALRTPDKK